MRSERLKSQILVGKSGNFINYSVGVAPPHAAKHAVENNYNAAKQCSYSTSIPSTSQRYEWIDNPRAAKHDGKNNCVTIQVNSSSIPPLVEKTRGRYLSCGKTWQEYLACRDRPRSRRIRFGMNQVTWCKTICARDNRTLVYEIWKAQKPNSRWKVR